MTGSPVPYDATALSAAVVGYLDARDERRFADALRHFAPDAQVVDDGQTLDGLSAIGAWIESSSTQWTYTTTRLAQQVDGDAVVVRVRIDGDFPGGTAELDQRFTLREGQIAQLSIAVPE